MNIDFISHYLPEILVIAFAIVALLQDYPGDDEVGLTVSNGTKIFKLKMCQSRVAYCDELRRRLAALIGYDNIRVESLKI